MKSIIRILLVLGCIGFGSSVMAQSSMTSPPSPNTQSGEITQPIQSAKPKTNPPASTGSSTMSESNYSRKPDSEADDTKGAIGTGKRNMNTKDPKFNGTRVKGQPLDGPIGDTIPR